MKGITRRILEEEFLVLSAIDVQRCMYKHEAKRGDFKRELRQGNPDCACIECDGYNDECSSYIKKQ